MRIAQFAILTVLALLSRGGTSAAQEAAPAAGIVIAEARLGTGVENRALTGEDSTFQAGSPVTLWMKVTGGNGENLTVTWTTGTAKFSTTLAVGGSPWRTWATKTVRGSGAWSVSISNSKGTELKTLHFTVK